MGLLKKKPESESIFQSLILNNSHVLWNELVRLWYSDQTLRPLRESEGIAALLERARRHLFDYQVFADIGMIKDFDFGASEEEPRWLIESSLEAKFITTFSGYNYWTGRDGSLSFLTQNSDGIRPILQTTSFYEGPDGKQVGFTSAKVAIFTWPFEDSYAQKGAAGLGPMGDGLAEVEEQLKRITSPVVMQGLCAATEFFTLGVKNKKWAKTGRSGILGKSLDERDFPTPSARITDGDLYVFDQTSSNWHGGYFPMIIEVGWSFTENSLDSEEAQLLLSGAPSVIHEIIADGDSRFRSYLSAFFGTPASWPEASFRSQGGLVSAHNLPDFMDAIDYNGAKNSLAYGFWLKGLGEGRVTSDRIQELLKGVEGEEETLIAKGNLALAHSLLGNNQEARKLAHEVLAEDPNNSEAAYIVTHTSGSDSHHGANVHSEEYAALAAKYSAPDWLAKALTGEGSSSNIDQSSAPEILPPLLAQFKEIAKVIDKYEFFQFHDLEGIRGAVWISPGRPNTLLIGMSDSDKGYLHEFPWVPNDSGYDDILEIEIPREVFDDENVATRLLSEIFDTYKNLELEVVPLGNTRSKINTYFPVRKVGAPPVPASKPEAGPVHRAGSNYQHRFVIGMTRQFGDDVDSGFDFF